MKPLLKWVGGKTQIIRDVLATFPREIGTYHEPFVGGGAVLLAVLASDDIEVKRVCASDNNPHLIAFYKHIQEDPERLHGLVDELFRAYDRNPAKEAFYYEQREHFRALPPCVEKSALLLFLNKTCFRGLYREGPSGFNAPYGHYKKTPHWPTVDDFRDAQKLLERVEFRVCDFSDALSRVASAGGDFVYADPPYAKETKTSFREYNQGGFDQERLFEEIKKLTAFTMSNANVPCVTEFFKDYKISYIKARRAIHSKNPSATTTEVLVHT